MFQNMNGGMLPVPFDRVIQDNFFASAPNLPYTFNFNSMPQMQQFNQLVAGYLIKVVQDNATRNPLRAFTANMLSQNRWMNPEFESAFLAVSDYAFVLLNTQMPNNVEGAILQAANQVASCLAAIYCQKFPALQQGIQPQQQQELQGLLMTYQQIAGAIQQMRQQATGGWGQQQQVGWGQQGMQFQQQRGNWAAANVQQQNSGWGQQQQPQQQQPQQQQYNNGWGQQRNNGWGQQQQNNGWGQQQQTHNTTEAVVARADERNAYSPAVQQTTTVEVQQLKSTDAIMEEWGNETTYKHGSAQVPQGQYSPPAPVAQPKAPVVQQEVVAGQDGYGPKLVTVVESIEEPGTFFPLDLSKMQFINKMTFISSDASKIWDQLVLETGEEVRPAHKSGWKITYDQTAPYGTYYNSKDYAKFHIRKINEDGSMVVREKLIKIDDSVRNSMQYLDHEIRKPLEYRLPQDAIVAEVPWAALSREAMPLENYAAHQEAQANLEEGQEPTPVEILSLKLAKACHSFEEAELNYHKEMICNSIPEDMVVEYGFRKVTPLFLSKPQLAKLSEMTQCENLLELAETLKFSDMDGLLKAKLNDLLTQSVNDALAYNLGFGGTWSIEDFMSDYAELGDALTDEGYVTVWDILNKERFRSIARSCLEVLTGEEQSAYLRDLIDGTPKDQRRQYQSVVSLVENNVVVHFPGVFDATFHSDIALQVTRDMDSQLYSALRASASRHSSDDKKPVKHHYFVDEAGVVLELHRGWLVSGSVLIRRVKHY